MAKTSILTILIQLAKQGNADRETIKGLAQLKSSVGTLVGTMGGLVGIGFAAQKVFAQTGAVFVAYAAQVREMSRLTGASAEETSRLIQAADDVMISYESLQKALWFASKNGVEVNIESIARLADEYNALAGPTEQATFLAKNFGKGGAEMGKLLEKGADGVHELADAIDGSLIMTDAAVASARLYEMQMDALRDRVEGLKMALGGGLVGVLTGSTAEITRQAQELFILENGYSFNTNQMGRYTDAQRAAWEEAKKLATEQWMLENGLTAAGDAASEAALAQEDYAASLEATAQRNQDVLSLIMDLQSETDNYTTKNDELKTKLAELTTEQGKYFEGGKKYNEIQSEIDETKGAIDELAAEHEAAGQRIAFSLLQQKMAVGGLSNAEFAALLSIGEQWGIVDAATARTALNMNRDADSIVSALNPVNGQMMDIVDKAQNLAGLSGSVFDFYVNIHTTGSFPNTRGNSSGPGAGQENNSGKDQEGDVDFKAAGGPLGAGWTIVGEEGFELIAPGGTYVFSNRDSKAMIAAGMIPEFRRRFGGEGPGVVTGSGSTFYQSQFKNKPRRSSSGGSSSGAGVSPVQQEVTAVADVVTPMAEATTAAVQTSAAAQQQAQIEAQQTRTTIENGNTAITDKLDQINQLLREQNSTIKRTVVAAVQQAMP